MIFCLFLDLGFDDIVSEDSEQWSVLLPAFAEYVVGRIVNTESTAQGWELVHSQLLSDKGPRRQACQVFRLSSLPRSEPNS